jgi:hypothetical protein
MNSYSGRDGIDSEEAKRSPLSPNFYLLNIESKNLETTAIERTIRHRNIHKQII